MVTFLVLVAVLLAAAGILNLSQATLGVGIVGLACLVGILARIAQASAHRDEAKAKP